VTRVTGDEQPATTWNRTEQVDEDKIVVERIFRLRERRPAPILEPNAQPSSKVVVADQISKFGSIPQSQNWCWVIDVNIVIRPAPLRQESQGQGEEQVVNGMRMRREVSGQGTAQLEIDEATGRIINKRLTQDTAEETRAFSEGQVLRIPPVPGPTTKHIVKTFQMITRLGDGAAVEETGTPSRSRKRDSGKPPPGGVEGPQPNQP
jgi:hypothetical protein